MVKCDKLSRLRSATRVERLTVVDTAQTTRVVLVKAANYKANPATDEVRVENQNHVPDVLA